MASYGKKSVEKDRIEQLEAERDDLALIIATDTGTESAVADLQRQLVAVTAERDELLACLNLIYSWANNWDSEFMNDPDWIDTDYPRIQAAIAKVKGQS